jgi:hypothetical protein
MEVQLESLRRVIAVVTLLVIVGCAPTQSAPEEPEPSLSSATLPLWKSDIPNCADPGMEVVGDTYYVVCTDKPNTYYTSTLSSHLADWTAHSMSLTLPGWVSGSSLWGMDLRKTGSGWYLYFSAQNRYNDGHRAIGVLHADSLTNGTHFSPIGSSDPLIKRDGYATIDPFVYNDDGQLWILYNQYGPGKHDSGIYINKLSNSYTKDPNDHASGLIRAWNADTPGSRMPDWTAWTVEAPALMKRGGYYYLFFSGNSYTNDTYATGVARSTSIDGHNDPYRFGRGLMNCARMKNEFHTSCSQGPGGATYAPGGFVFHARLGGDGSDRRLYSGRLGYDRYGWPYLRSRAAASLASAPNTSRSPQIGAWSLSGDTLTVQVTDDDIVDLVDFWVDGQIIDSVYSPPFTVTLPAGQHTVSVEAYDKDDNVGLATRVLNIVPAVAVQITSPQNGAWKSTDDWFPVTASASSSAPVVAVDFYANGTFFGSSRTAPFVSFRHRCVRK